MATGTTRGGQPTVPTSIAPIPRERRTLSPLDVDPLERPRWGSSCS